MSEQDEHACDAKAVPSSQSWRAAAYAGASAVDCKPHHPTPVPVSSSSQSKSRSSLHQRAATAGGLLKQSGSGEESKPAGTSANVCRQPSSSGLKGLPLYSDKAAEEIRSLTDKKAMKSKANPITHSRMAERTQHYVSSSTGHQVANRMIASFPVAAWRDVRQSKLREQAADKTTDIFKGVTAYLNGYQGKDKVNIDITRKIQENGGKVNYLYSKSQCTHIISSRPLSAKKNQEWLLDKKKSAQIVKFVRPEWVFDSIAAGKRLVESKYPVFSDESQGSILAAFGRQKEDADPAKQRAAEPSQPSDKPDSPETSLGTSKLT